MTAQTRPAAEAWGVVQYLSGDEEARLLADYEEMARRDEADRLKGAYKKGYEIGYEKGYEKGLRQARQQQVMIEIVQKALLMKFSVEVIAGVTGLSLEEVNQIAASQNLDGLSAFFRYG